MGKSKNTENKRRDKELGQLAQLVRRRMIQKSHSLDGYDRKKEKKYLRNLEGEDF